MKTKPSGHMHSEHHASGKCLKPAPVLAEKITKRGVSKKQLAASGYASLWTQPVDSDFRSFPGHGHGSPFIDEACLKEFRRIRNFEKITLETFHSIRKY